jgi:hypothetical protein
MGRPRGSTKKSEVMEENRVEEKEKETEVLMALAVVEEKLEPLQPGQKYFEAPDGTIIIGEEDKQQVWYRKLNNGRGGWINPRR